MHTHTYMHIPTSYMYAYMHTHIYTYVHTCTHTHSLTHSSTHSFIYSHTYSQHKPNVGYFSALVYSQGKQKVVVDIKHSLKHLYSHTYIHTHTHTYVHTYIHTYIHTYTVSKDVPPAMKSSVTGVTNLFLMFGVLSGIAISSILSALMLIT